MKPYIFKRRPFRCADDPIFDVKDHDETNETFDDHFEDDLSEFNWEVAKQTECRDRS